MTGGLVLRVDIALMGAAFRAGRGEGQNGTLPALRMLLAAVRPTDSAGSAGGLPGAEIRQDLSR